MITRRRMMTILGGAMAVPNAVWAGGASGGSARVAWHGVAMGAGAQIVIDHADGEALITLARAEIARLEKLFSLYDANSDLSRLNQTGVLRDPSPDFLALLSLADQVHSATQGAFDPTVQPLWALYADRFATQNRAPTPTEISAVLPRLGWQKIAISPTEIRLARGMALSFNGIAQGFIADRVTDVLRQNGVVHTLVNTGEIRSLGGPQTGGDWPITLKGHGNIALAGRALATSAPLGTSFDRQGKFGHMLDARTGNTLPAGPQVSVLAPTAGLADGLSTGFCAMERRDVDQTVANHPSRIDVIYTDVI